MGLWIRTDTDALEITNADGHPEHGEWIEAGEALRMIREYNERKAREEQTKRSHVFAGKDFVFDGPGFDPTGEGSAWQPEARPHVVADPKLIPNGRSYEGGMENPASTCQGEGPAKSAGPVVPAGWVAIETLTDERDRLRAQVSRLRDERDVALGRAVLAERARAELLADLQGILQEVPPATNGKPTP